MTYTFHKDTNIKELDEFVENHPQNSLYQCSNWAKVKNNWDHFFTSVTDEKGIIVATALVLKRNMPLGKSLFYIPRGPVMDYKNKELVKFYLDELTKLAKQNNAIALRFDPSVLSRKYSYETRNEDHPYENNDVIEFLKSLGAKHKGFTTMIEEATQPRFNAAMTCTSDYLDKLDHKVKQSIRTAERKGAEIYEGHQYIHEFSLAMHYTEERKGVALRSEEYFKNMAEVYGDHCIIMVAKLNFPKQIQKLESEIQQAQKDMDETPYKKQKNQFKQFISNAQKEIETLKKEHAKESKDEIILSGKLAIYNKNRMEFVYAGNNAEYLRLRTIYLLYKKYFDICVEKGIQYVSMGGIEGTLDDGLTKFKSSWLLDIEEYIGEFNIVLDPMMYAAFDKVYPFLLKQAARIRSGKKEVVH